MAIEKNRSIRRGRGKKVVVTLLVVAWLAGTGFLAFKVFDYRKDNKDLRNQLASTTQKLETIRTNPEQAAQEEVDRYVEEVGKHYVLPENEKPSVATVSDKTKLQDQPFFAKAENGDVTLIYAKAKLAILYRPSTKRIINVSSVIIEDDQPADTSPN